MFLNNLITVKIKVQSLIWELYFLRTILNNIRRTILNLRDVIKNNLFTAIKIKEANERNFV